MPRKPLEKLQWTEVESSNVNALMWDDPTQTICVRFSSGGVYSYIGANFEKYEDLLMAPSIGHHLDSVLKKGGFPYTRWDTEDDLLHHLNVS